MSTLDLVINGSAEQVTAGATVADLVRRWARTETGVAVAVNDTVVTRADWPAVQLQPGDRVEILTAVQGG